MNEYINLKKNINELRSDLSKITYPSLQNQVEKILKDIQSLERRTERQKNRIEARTFSFFKRTSDQEKMISFFNDIENLKRVIYSYTTQQSALINAETNKTKDKEILVKNLQLFIQKFDHFIQMYGYAVSFVNQENLFLGISSTGDVFSLSTPNRLKHLYSVGSTGVGKSRFLESLIIQDLLAGRGGMLIDPMGGLFRSVSAFCFYYEEIRKNFEELQEEIRGFFREHEDQIKDFSDIKNSFPITDKLTILEKMTNITLDEVFPPLNFKVIDFSDEANTNPYRINPFQPEPNEPIRETVDTLLKSIERHTNITADQTPRFRNIFKSLVSYCIENKKQLKDIIDVINILRFYAGQGTKKSYPLDDKVLEKLKTSSSKTSWFARWYIEEKLLKDSKQVFDQNIESTINRISFFLDNEIVGNLLDTPKTTLSLTDEINFESKRRPFLLFFIPTYLDGADMLATYLLTKMDKILFRRTDEEAKRVFFCYIDEFHRFIDDKLADNFSGVRQKGCGYIIAHQNFEQLKKDDLSGFRFHTIFNNCDTKIVMRTRGEGVDHIVKECFELTGKLEKITYSTSIGERVAIGYNVSNAINNSKNRSKTVSKTEGDSWSKTFGTTVAESLSNAVGNSFTTAKSDGQTTNTTDSKTDSKTSPVYQNYDYKSGTQSAGAVLSYGKGETTNKTESNAKNNTETKTRSNSKTESELKGGTLTRGDSESEGFSEGFTETLGLSGNYGIDISHTLNHQYFSLEEEGIFLGQSIRKLMEREMFISFPGLVTHKAVTLDSLPLKLAGNMKHITEKFYPYLFKTQKEEREEMEKMQNPETEIKISESEKPIKEKKLFGI